MFYVLRLPYAYPIKLKHIGLSENEAKVYVAMLELGPSPVLEIAAKAGINRPTAYVQIESWQSVLDADGNKVLMGVL